MKDIYLFINEGNLCYFITALQILVTNNIFKTVVNTYPVYHGNKSNKIILLTKQIINSDIKHTIGNYNIHATINPKELKYEFSLLNNFFSTNEQQDTQECLLLLIEEYSKIFSHDYKRKLHSYFKHYTTDQVSKYNNVLKLYDEKTSKSFISEMFLGLFLNIKQCTNIECKFQDYNFEVFLNIILVPKQKYSVVQCIQDYLKTEQVVLNCEKCHNNKFVKKTSFITMPYILSVFIKRYDEHTFNTRIEINSNFTVPINGTYFKYRLKMIVNHLGHNINSGHYNIDIDNIYKIDNNRIIKINNDNNDNIIISNTAYIVIYELEEQEQ